MGSSRRCARQSSPRCTRAPAVLVVCPVACPTWVAPPLVVTRPVVLPLAGQPLRRSINTYLTNATLICAPLSPQKNKTLNLDPHLPHPIFHVKPCNVSS